MKIPKDLRPGDRLWYSMAEYATVGVDSHCYDSATFDSVLSPLVWAIDQFHGDHYGGHRFIFRLSDGIAMNDMGKRIIRIERIASKPKKADKDAAWLLRHFGNTPPCGWGKRLRTIARRLNGGAL